jgi:ribosomal protein L3 glutamine methyltransferase
LVRSRSSARKAALATGPWTIERWVEYGARRLRAARVAFGHGTLTARDEAAYLTLHVLGLPLDDVESVRARRLSEPQLQRVAALFARRIRERRPAAYLTGEAWLGDFKFYVDERAIIPRSYNAELLHEDLAPWIPDPGRIRSALDLCTGSGCLAILLAHAFPRARIDAADISSAALAVARINVRNYRLDHRIHLIKSDIFSAIREKRYDLIISNPPYVRTALMRRLPSEYRCEPPEALDAGADGLSFVYRILCTARRFLKPGGLLVVEVGHNRARVERAYPRVAFTWAETSGGEDCVFLLSCDQLPADRGRAAGPARPRGRDGTSGRA